MITSSQWPVDDTRYPEHWTDSRKDIGVYSNSYYPGKWFSKRDTNLLSSFNAELFSDIIECVVQIFKICPSETGFNIYGESSGKNGKVFFNGINMTTLVQRQDITGESNAGFGVDRNQSVVFRFRERNCTLVNFFPEIGDLILYNERYYEIDNVIQEQFLGGHPDKSWSFICNTHYSRLSKINTVERQT